MILKALVDRVGAEGELGGVEGGLEISPPKLHTS